MHVDPSSTLAALRTVVQYRELIKTDKHENGEVMLALMVVGIDSDLDTNRRVAAAVVLQVGEKVRKWISS